MAKTDFLVENGELKNYSGTEERIIIPDEVSTIGFNAFNNCDSLVTVVIPETVKCIKGSAFWKCENLKEIQFLGGLPDIEDGAILSCNSLTLSTEVFHTEEKLPIGLIDCVRVDKTNCNISAEEIAWIALYQGNRKWKELAFNSTLFGAIDDVEVAEWICKIVSETPKLAKKTKDAAIHYMTENYKYQQLYKLVGEILSLNAKEINSYMEKYKDEDKVCEIFQNVKEKFSNNASLNMAEKKSDEEVTLKDARKKFKLGNVENGIVIKGYVGEDDSVNIPKIIGGKKVLSIEVRTFFARNMTVTGLERYESTFQKEQLHNANVGDTVTFGTYCFEKDGQNAKIDWSVVAKEEDKMLLLTKQAIDVLPFNRLHKDSVWENSDIRKWLNDIFLQYAFSGEEMSLIQTSSVSNNGNENFGVKGSDITNDKVFLLSIEEVLKLSEVKIGKGAEPTPYAKSKKPVIVGGLCRWWLRTPGKDVGDVAFVAENETIMGMDPHRALGHGLWDDTADIAIRPAIWIKI